MRTRLLTMVKETKLYDTLSIKPEASQDEIKKGYRYVLYALVCLLPHADSRGGPSSPLRSLGCTVD